MTRIFGNKRSCRWALEMADSRPIPCWRAQGTICSSQQFRQVDDSSASAKSHEKARRPARVYDPSNPRNPLRRTRRLDLLGRVSRRSPQPVKSVLVMIERKSAYVAPFFFYQRMVQFVFAARSATIQQRVEFHAACRF